MYRIGFDVGGTNIKAGIVDGQSRLIAYRRIPFPTGEHYKKVAESMAKLAKDLIREEKYDPSELRSIGLAIPGDIDVRGERVINAHNLHFHNVPMKKALEEHFPGVPVFLGNDANAAALAELRAGAFQGCQTAVLITLGTGVGGGLILGGRMFNGGRGHGVELGHMTLQQGGELCTCGRRGCVESVCTGTWLVRQGRKAVIEYPLGMINKRARGRLERVNAKLVIDCAKAGDVVALDIFQQYLDNLSSAIVSVAMLIDPEIIALGGGVSLAGDFLYKPLSRLVREKSFFKCSYTIVPAALGNDAGIIGAALLAENCKD